MTTSTSDLATSFPLQPTSQQKRRMQYSTLIMVIVALLAVLSAVLICSWAATRALLPSSIDESGRSRLDADYSAWEFGAPLLQIDISGLATAASRGEGDWNEGNLPAASTDEPTQTPQLGTPSTSPDATDEPTPTATATGSPAPTRVGGTGAPTTASTSAATNPPTVPGSTSAPTVPGSTSAPTVPSAPTTPPPTDPPTEPPTTDPPPTDPPTEPPTDPPPTCEVSGPDC